MYKERVIPSRESVFVKNATKIIGGPVGRYARIGNAKFFTPWRVILLFTLISLAIGWSTKAACLQQSNSSGGLLHLNWINNRQYWSLCYTEIIDKPPASLHWAFTDNNIAAYLFGLVFFVFFALAKLLSSFLTRFGLDELLPEIIYFNLQAFILSFAWIIVVFLVFKLAKNNPWNAIWVGICPLLWFQAFTGYRILTVLLLVGCYYFWTTSKSFLAGILAALVIIDFPLTLFIVLFLSLIPMNSNIRDNLQRIFIVTWISFLSILIVLGVLLGGTNWVAVWLNRLIPNLTVDSVYSAIFGVISTDPNYWNPLPTNIYMRLLEFTIFTLWLFIVTISANYLHKKFPVYVYIFVLLAGYSVLSFSWKISDFLLLVPFLVLSIPKIDITLGWMLWVSLLWLPKMFSSVDSYAKGLPTQWYFLAYLLNSLILLSLAVYTVYDRLRGVINLQKRKFHL